MKKNQNSTYEKMPKTTTLPPKMANYSPLAEASISSYQVKYKIYVLGFFLAFLKPVNALSFLGMEGEKC